MKYNWSYVTYFNYSLQQYKEKLEFGQQTLQFANYSGNKICSYEVSNYNSIISQLSLNCSVKTT